MAYILLLTGSPVHHESIPRQHRYRLVWRRIPSGLVLSATIERENRNDLLPEVDVSRLLRHLPTRLRHLRGCHEFEDVHRRPGNRRSRGAGIATGGLSVIAIVTPSEKRALFTGLLLSLYALGTAVAPVIGGALTEHATWRWCFFINLPAGAVTIATLLLFFKPPAQQNPDQQTSLRLRDKILQLDLIGCGLFIPAIVMVLLALEWGGHEYPWNSPTVIGLFVGFGVVIIIFAIWEKHKGDEAMIPFSVLGQRSIFLSALFAFLILGSFIIPVYYLPEWFQVVKGASPMRSGVMMLPSVIAQSVGSILSGILGEFLRSSTLYLVTLR